MDITTDSTTVEMQQFVEERDIFSANEAELIMANIEALINRASITRGMMARTGHDGDRNYDKQLGYTFDPDDEEFLTRYRRFPELRRAVDIIPKLAWRKAPKVTEDGKDDTEFAVAFARLAQEINLWGKLQRADRLSRAFRFSTIVLGFNDAPVSDPTAANDLELPVGVISTERKLLYLQPYSSRSMNVKKWDLDLSSPRYRLPSLYELEHDDADTTSGDVTRSSRKQRVHYERVLHIAFDPLESEVFGEPISAAIWDVLDDVLKGISGPIEGTWRIAVAQKMLLKLKDGVEWAKDPTSATATARADELALKLDRMIHNLTSAMVGSDIESIQQLQGVPVDPRPAAEVSWHRIAMAIGIPYRVYTGAEEAEMASTQDAAQMAAVVRASQHDHCEKVILRPLINRLIAFNVLPTPKAPITIGDFNPESEEYEWPNPIELSEHQLAEILGTRARAAKALQDARLGGAPISGNEVRKAGKLPPVDGQESTEPLTLESVNDPRRDDGELEEGSEPERD